MEYWTVLYTQIKSPFVISVEDLMISDIIIIHIGIQSVLLYNSRYKCAYKIPNQ